MKYRLRIDSSGKAGKTRLIIMKSRSVGATTMSHALKTYFIKNISFPV